MSIANITYFNMTRKIVKNSQPSSEMSAGGTAEIGTCSHPGWCHVSPAASMLCYLSLCAGQFARNYILDTWLRHEGLLWKRRTEQEGFEPPVPFDTTVFKTVALSHSATAPRAREESAPTNPPVLYTRAAQTARRSGQARGANATSPHPGDYPDREEPVRSLCH